MKLLPVLALVCLIVISSCQKQAISPRVNAHYLERVRADLKPQLSVADFNSLDFSRVVRCGSDSLPFYVLRIPVLGKSITDDFVVLQTTADGAILKGRIIHLEGSALEYGEGSPKCKKFDGTINISSLDRKDVMHSEITNGFIKAFLPSSQTQVTTSYVESDPYLPLPEVVIVSTYSSGGGIDLSTYISLVSLLGNPTSIEGSNYYVNLSGGGGGGSSAGGGQASYNGGDYSAGEQPIQGDESMIKIDFERQDDDNPIDVRKFLDCFSAIPDEGSTSSITILTDIPVDGDPGKFFDWESESPGHTFIQITKQNGSQFVSQNLGFYPREGYKQVLRPEPTAAKVVDNSYHGYNAAYEIKISPIQLKKAISEIVSLATSKAYDIDDYNCTDWSLNVFNAAVGIDQQLVIPKYRIPGGATPYGSSTPQGLYRRLMKLEALGGKEAAGITIPLAGSVGASTGPCQIPMIP